MSPVPSLSHTRIASAIAALTLIVPGATPLAAQAATAAAPEHLAELIPATAYSLISSHHEPSMEFVCEATRQVVKAVGEARFGDLIVDVVEATGAAESDVSQVAALVDLVTGLVASIDWEALVENEWVYGESSSAPLPGLLPWMGGAIFACRPDADRVAGLEQALAGLLSAADNLTDQLDLLREEHGAAGEGATRIYSLKASRLENLPLLQLAVRGDVILAGFGNDVFADALAILEGRSTRSLVRTRRYHTAVGDLADGMAEVAYVDTHRLMSWLGEAIPRMIEDNGAPWQASAIVRDLFELADIVDMVVVVQHAQGHELITETWTTFRPEVVQAGNPLYLAMSGAEPSGELLDFVPADAISFSMTQDIDLRPLYRWALQRIEDYVPQASDSLLAWQAAQAITDMSVEDDLLSWLGSETIAITMPSKQPGKKVDTILLSRLRDPAGARKVIARCEAIYAAVVPPLLARLDEEMASKGGSPIRKLELRLARGSYPSMKQLEIAIRIPGPPIPIPPIPTITFGIIGRLLVVTTSEQALERVMAVAAGEADGLWDHPALAEGSRLPSAAVCSASLEPIGRQLRKVSNVIGALASTFGMAAAADRRGNDSEEARIVGLITSLMGRAGSILRAIDFLDDQVCYCEWRDDGLLRYSRSSTRYLTDEQR